MIIRKARKAIPMALKLPKGSRRLINRASTGLGGIGKIAQGNSLKGVEGNKSPKPRAGK